MEGVGDANSNSQQFDLEALFDNALNPGGVQLQQVPWSMRKLPDSFFHPPEGESKSCGHSRDPSADSGTYTSSESSSHTIPVHRKTNSSPAAFQVYQKEPSHRRRRRNRSQELTKNWDSLPYGWQQTRTPDGKTYFLNHLTKTSTWDDPRNSAGISHANFLGPLPPHWEQTFTPEGRVYFIDHATHTTTWCDPRISRQSQISHDEVRLRLLEFERRKMNEKFLAQTFENNRLSTMTYSSMVIEQENENTRHVEPFEDSMMWSETVTNGMQCSSSQDASNNGKNKEIEFENIDLSEFGYSDDILSLLGLEG